MSRRPPGSLVPLSAKLAPEREIVAQRPAAVERGFPLVIVDPQNLFRRGLSLLVRQWYPDASILEAGDIGQVFATAYDRGRFRRRLAYRKPCPAPLRPEQQRWVDEVVAAIFP